MKELFLLLLFIAGAVAVPEYHGDRRFWTIVDANGKTEVALHVLNDPVNLIFPKGKTIAQLLSDMKMLSPSGNVQCQDMTNTLNFKLAFVGDEKYIRGEVKVEMVNDVINIMMYLYEKCGSTERRSHYVARAIEDTELLLESTGRLCFKNGEPPFRQYGTNTGDNVMELQVTPGAFGCQAFMILPEYMRVEDGPLPKAQVNPLNSTFAEKGDAYWWKKESHEWLPSAVSFVGKDVKINILNSSKANPIFLRIGNNSVIPAFKFAFSPSCNSFKTELYLNFKDEPGCKIDIETTQAGFKFSTKGALAKEIRDGSKSPSLVFDETKNLVYVKVDNPLSVHAFDTCTMARSASDQLVVQIASDDGGQCDFADVTLNQRDIEKTIDVLIDRAKIVEPNVTIATNGTENTTIATVVIAATTQKAEDAGFQWWWVAVPLGIIVLIGVIVITYLCIRRRKRNQKQKPKGFLRVINKEDRSISHDKEIQPKSPDVKTAIPPESSRKKKTNEKKKAGELDESNKGSKKSKKEKSQPSKSKPSEVENFDRYVYVKDHVAPPQPIAPSPKPCLFEVAGTEQTQTETTVENAPRPELKNRSMYGEGGFEQMDKPFDYHLNEGLKHEPTINFAAVKVSTPKLQQFRNFWSCIGYLSAPKRYSPIFVNSKVDGKNVYFMIRDCVAQESKYSAFRTLANRMFEPFKFKANAPEENAKSIDDENKYFVLRIFILSYEPLTMEVHCRGQVPLFLFDIFECKQCRDIGKRLRNSKFEISKSDCHGNWDCLVCRVNTTPMNSHHFLSVNDPEKPRTAEGINHVLVIRGNREPNKLRKCIRRCDFVDWSHPNNFIIENDFQGGGDSTVQTHGSEKQMNDSTLQTQGTQPSSKELKG